MLIKQILPLLIITLSLTTLSAQRFNAQKGFIVKPTNDTVYGQVKDRSNIRKSVLFQPDGATEFNTLAPAEISVFYYEGGYYYRSVTVPVSDSTSEQQFLLCLAEGYMSLYYTGAFYYIAKPNSPLAKIDKNDLSTDAGSGLNKRYIKVLAFLMADCPQISGDIGRTGYNNNSLTNIVNAYNLCKVPDGKSVVHKERFKRKPQFGARVGMVSGDIAYIVPEARFYSRDLQPRRKFTGGLTCNFPINRKFSFQPELLLTPKSAYYDFWATDKYLRELDIHLLFLQLPLMFYYHLPVEKIRPFAGAGMVAGYILKKDARYTRGLGSDLDISTDELGIRCSGGIAFSIRKTTQLSLEYSYERTIINRTYVSEKIRSVSHYFWLSVQTELFP